MGQTTPERLLVCVFRLAYPLSEGVGMFYTEGRAVPAELQAVREDHLRYVYDLSKRGILWLGGASADSMTGLNIYAVDSLEEARKALRNDPFYVHRLFYDDQYFEWEIHMPPGMATPAYRKLVEDTWRRLGIVPDSL